MCRGRVCAEWVCICESVFVCVCVCRGRVCVCAKEPKCVRCVGSERERERESVCVNMCIQHIVLLCV